jgi:hypothetical protein
MKRIINRLLLLPLIALVAGGCTDEPLSFEHEKPQFEINPNAILLEVLLPTSSTDDDSYYIVGDFNGGDAAIGNATWQLTKATTGIVKWGIYLDPSKFVGGKTLSDGFHFYSVAQGEERSIKNQPVNHILDVKVGSRTNVWVDQWETYFGERPREYSRVYLYNQRGWDAIALYYWGDASAGAWPGLQPSGTETIDGIPFTYFNLDASISGMVINLIPNNNGGGEQIEDASVSSWTVAGDFYLALTEAGGVVMDPDNLVIPYDGNTVYVDDQTGWDALALFGWLNYAALDVAYPGWQVNGTEVINGVEYKYFNLPEKMNDQVINFVFNNNLPATSADKKEVNGPQNYTMSEDIYIRLTASKSEIINPYGVERKIYVTDNTGWDAIALHYWGDGISGTTWPGIAPSGTEEIGGVTYKVFTLPGQLDGKTMNWILNNNNNGSQFDCPSILVSRDFVFDATMTGVTELMPKMFVDNQSGWAEVNLYYYPEGTTGKSWPGFQPTGTQTVGDVEYTVFELPYALTGQTVNFIFNNNSGSQTPDVNATAFGNMYYRLTADGATVVNP